LAGIGPRGRTWLRIIAKPVWQIQKASNTPNPSAAIAAHINTTVFTKSCIMASKHIGTYRFAKLPSCLGVIFSHLDAAQRAISPLASYECILAEWVSPLTMLSIGE